MKKLTRKIAYAGHSFFPDRKAAYESICKVVNEQADKINELIDEVEKLKKQLAMEGDQHDPRT